MCVRMHMCMFVYMCDVCGRTYAYVYVHVCVCTCVCLCVHMCITVCMCVDEHGAAEQVTGIVSLIALVRGDPGCNIHCVAFY